MTMLFLNIARMDSYRGWTSVDVPVGGGRDPNKMEVHNFHPYRGHVYGYVAAVAHSIRIKKLGATDSKQESIDGVDVVWTAPSIRGGRDVVGWYRDATVFRYLQKYRRGPYHAKASSTTYVLLPPNERRLNIKSARVQPGGFGNSNVWYAESDYGRRIRARVTRLFRNTTRQVFDRDDLEDQADALEPLDQVPEGVEKPARTKREITVVGRHPEVQRWVFQCADGRCELCGKRAPFEKENGTLFLEIHHVCRLADGGADVPENAVALCPNCHREAHYGARRDSIRMKLSKHALRRSRQ
ncbi:MAG: HNH endonuclease signature motif containing protein [Chloroflexi bacterium]|nr:HNH endonuclease signature motif containing protein [Chloroflexota bacterium]